MFILYKVNIIPKFKKTWEKLDAETVRLKNILDKNGTPTPKVIGYFPYQKYSNYIWKLFDNVSNFTIKKTAQLPTGRNFRNYQSWVIDVISA